MEIFIAMLVFGIWIGAVSSCVSATSHSEKQRAEREQQRARCVPVCAPHPALEMVDGKCLCNESVTLHDPYTFYPPTKR